MNKGPADLVFEAASAALKDAGLNIDDIDHIDCIINSSATIEQVIPYNAANTHRILQAKNNIPSFDINITCLSPL